MTTIHGTYYIWEEISEKAIIIIERLTEYFILQNDKQIISLKSINAMFSIQDDLGESYEECYESTHNEKYSFTYFPMPLKFIRICSY